MSFDKSIQVKSWSITPPTFEELWGGIKDNLKNLNSKEVEINKLTAEYIYTNFYADIKKQLEGKDGR